MTVYSLFNLSQSAIPSSKCQKLDPKEKIASQWFMVYSHQNKNIRLWYIENVNNFSQNIRLSESICEVLDWSKEYELVPWVKNTKCEKIKPWILCENEIFNDPLAGNVHILSTIIKEYGQFL